jgi:hypothetical protein
MTGGLATLIILAAVAACFPGIRRFQIQWDLVPEDAHGAMSDQATNRLDRFPSNPADS